MSCELVRTNAHEIHHSCLFDQQARLGQYCRKPVQQFKMLQLPFTPDTSSSAVYTCRAHSPHLSYCAQLSARTCSTSSRAMQRPGSLCQESHYHICRLSRGLSARTCSTSAVHRRRAGPACPHSGNGKTSEEIFNAEDFNLALAATMGACSFEAYNAPYVMHGIKEVDDNHSQTVYMKRGFLDDIMHGVLQVHIRRAEGLRKPTNNDGKECDLHPRIMVSAGPSCGWSSTESDTTDPIYGQTMFLYVRKPVTEPLIITLHHCTSKTNQKSGEIARAEFPDIESICDGKHHELAIDLEGEKGPAGTVFLGVQYSRHDEENDVLTDLSIQAAGQMMSDDWGWGVPEQDWYNDTQYEWRSHLVKADTLPAYTPKEEHPPLDITGEPAGSGEPLDRPPWDMWKSLRESIVTRELSSTFEPFAFLTHVPSDTEAWVFVNDSNQICISFRGTSSPADMAKDALCDLAAFSPGDRPKSRQPEEVAEEISDEEVQEGPMGGLLRVAKMIDSIPIVPQIGRLVAKSTGGRGSGVQGKPPLSGWAKAQGLMVYSAEHDERWVHNGFLQSYVAVQKPLIRLLDEIMTNGEQWHVYCTGHSMGGALATFCAYEVASMDFKHVPRPKVSTFTFGSPRVGNIPFAEDYDKLIPSTWRVANENDIVTRIPSLLGYRHVGVEVRITSEGGVKVARISSDQVREGAVLSDIVPRIKEGLWGKDKKLKAEFRQLIKGEWEVSQALMRGHAIAEHMEDKYHDILKACVEAGGDECKPNLKDVDEAMSA